LIKSEITMTPSEIGPWLMLGLGALSIVAALYATVFLRPVKKGLIVLWIFGLAMLGIGSYGPMFLSEYGSFVSTMTSLNATPSKETYQQAFDKVASGKLTGDYGNIVLRYAVNHPVEGTDTLLRASIGTATNPAGRNALLSADTLLTQKYAVANRLMESVLHDTSATRTLESFDPATRALVAQSLLRFHTRQTEGPKMQHSSLEHMDEAGHRAK
jgi:hypothetical protein